MNTRHRTNAPLTIGQPFHASTRTSASRNRDPQTGAETQLLTTSQLELSWECGELRIRCRASCLVLDTSRAERIGGRPYRG